MLIIKNDNELHFNRGDSFNIELFCSNGAFDKNAVVVMHILEAGDMQNEIAFKNIPFDVEDTSSDKKRWLLKFNSEDTIWEETKDLKSGRMEFWYELKYFYNEKHEQEDGTKTYIAKDVTLLGYDINGPKKLFVYPEAHSLAYPQANIGRDMSNISDTNLWPKDSETGELSEQYFHPSNPAGEDTNTSTQVSV